MRTCALLIAANLKAPLVLPLRSAVAVALVLTPLILLPLVSLA